MFQRLLIATDLMDGLDRLANFLPSLAAAGFKKIVFLHVVPLGSDDGVPRVDVDLIEATKQQLTEAVKQSTNGIEAAIEVQTGLAPDLILKTAQTHQVDLVILGTETRSLLSEKLFGSTTTKLCQQLAIPLMVVRPQLISTLTTEELDLRCRHLFRCLLIPYDGDAVSKHLLQQIKHQAEQSPTPVVDNCLLCSVISEGGVMGLGKEEQMKQAQTALEEAKAELSGVNLNVETIVRQGNATAVIMEIARTNDVHAIAISSKNVGKLWELSTSSLGGEILRQSWHPVLFFPPS